MSSVSVNVPYQVKAEMRDLKGDLRYFLTRPSFVHEVPSIASSETDGAVTVDDMRVRIVDGVAFLPIRTSGTFEDLCGRLTAKRYEGLTHSPFAFQHRQGAQDVSGMANLDFLQWSVVDKPSVSLLDHDAALGLSLRVAQELLFVDGLIHTSKYEPYAEVDSVGTLRLQWRNKHDWRVLPLAGRRVEIPVQDVEDQSLMLGATQASRARFLALHGPMSDMLAPPRNEGFSREVWGATIFMLRSIFPSSGGLALVGSGDPGQVDLPQGLDDIARAGRRALRALDADLRDGGDGYGETDACIAFLRDAIDEVTALTQGVRSSSGQADLQDEVLVRIEKTLLLWERVHRDRRVNETFRPTGDDMDAILAMTP